LRVSIGELIQLDHPSGDIGGLDTDDIDDIMDEGDDDGNT